MATPVLMPKQGITVESCIITKWNKQAGDAVHTGDILFSYETDKASFECEATEDGTLLGVFFEEGDEVPVLTNVCVIGSEGEDFSSFRPSSSAVQAETAETENNAKSEAAQISEAPSAQHPVINDNGRIFASPRARNLAEKNGIDLAEVTPTGPKGRIVEADVRNSSASVPKSEEFISDTVAAPLDAPEFEDVKLPNIRKAIAKSMTASLTTMAQLTHTISFDATNMLQFRSMLKKNGELIGMGNITINDILIFTTARILKSHRDLNANLLDGTVMRYFKNVHMGIAVDTPRGLLVPTLFNADLKSLSEISVEAKTLAKNAQAGSISPELLRGGTFTISNLGSFGIESFTPVINPPQTGILGVNTISTRVRDVNGQAVPYQAMTLSLTYDHRALDGAPASRFLKELATALENFSIFLAK